MALQTAKVIGVMEELQAKMNRVLVKNLENSLNNLVKSEISASGAAKKKFDSTKKPQKGDPIVSETLTTLNDCNFKCDHQLQIGLCSILEEYYKLFETGHFYMHRNLPTLMDFRTTIQLDVRFPFFLLPPLLLFSLLSPFLSTSFPFSPLPLLSPFLILPRLLSGSHPPFPFNLSQQKSPSILSFQGATSSSFL